MVYLALRSCFGDTLMYLKESKDYIYSYGEKKEAMKFKDAEEAKAFIEKVSGKEIKKHVARHLEVIDD